jgi:hypothetical protein
VRVIRRARVSCDPSTPARLPRDSRATPARSAPLLAFDGSPLPRDSRATPARLPRGRLGAYARGSVSRKCSHSASIDGSHHSASSETSLPARSSLIPQRSPHTASDGQRIVEPGASIRSTADRRSSRARPRGTSIPAERTSRIAESTSSDSARNHPGISPRPRPPGAPGRGAPRRGPDGRSPPS